MMQPVRIGLLGWFGAQNLGNECTLQAIIHNLRKYLPTADLTCICVAPEDTEARHGIPAVSMTESFPTIRTSQWFRVKRNAIVKTIGKVYFRLLRIPITISGWLKAFRVVRGMQMLIVPGTGLLTDAYSTPFGWPYSIFKWSVVAKICRCRLLFVSVGAGPIYHPLSRWFIKSALWMADFRSYREWSTVRYLESIGLPVGNDRVFPDLAFNLPANLLARGDGRRRKRPVVGIGVMHYAGRLSVDSPCESTYRAYLKTLAEFIEWLFARQYDVSVLVGDAADDVHVVKDLEDLLKVRGSFDEARIIDDPVLTVRDVLTRLAETDAVVATRFHNALLALVLNKPVIMISFHHKCVSLMNEIGLSNYCEDIHCLSADKLIARFAELEQNEAGLKESIKEKVAERRQALDEQYEIIFGGECPVVGMSYLASSGRSCPN